jgi:hypothetical protein
MKNITPYFLGVLISSKYYHSILKFINNYPENNLKANYAKNDGIGVLEKI